jgi:prepilin-type N-terminal cleavage/methylation domain-containing protein
VKKANGFTLIELLLTVSIISVIGILSTGFYSRFLLQNAVANTSDQLIADLRKAQMYSMTGKYNLTNTTWGVRYGSNTITLFLGSSYATRNSAFDETFTVSPSVTISGFTELVFAKTTGLPTGGNPSNTPTIVISGGSSSKTITVNSQGIASR